MKMEENNITKIQGKINYGRFEVGQWKGQGRRGLRLKNGLSRFTAKLQVPVSTEICEESKANSETRIL